MQARGVTRWLALGAIVLALILVPFALFGEAIESWATATLTALHGQPALAGALITSLLAGDSLLPIPSSVVSAAAGTILGWTLGTIVIWSGMTLGAVIAYALGGSAARRLAPRWFPLPELERARRLFVEVGPVALIVTRAVPVLSEAGALAAGAARMPFGLFFVTVALADAAVAAAYAAVGAAAAPFGWFVAVFTALAVIPALAWMARGSRR